MQPLQKRRARAVAQAGWVAELFADPAPGPSASERSRALRAVERLRGLPVNGERLHVIVTRCEVRGEPHKAVASELGISRRQFYRDLSFARTWIAGSVRAGPPSAEAADKTATGDARAHTALLLSAVGRGSAAIAHLAPFVDALAGDERIWGRCALADLHLDDADFTGARRALAAARADCSSDAGRARILVSEAKLLAHDGGDAPAILERALSLLDAPPASDSTTRTETYSEAATLLAFCYHESGRFAAAASTHARNPGTLDRALLSPFAARQYLNVDAMLACDAGNGPAEAQIACSAFHDFAVSRGYLDDVAAALVRMAGVARFELRTGDADRLSREALTIARAIDLPETEILIMLAALCVDRGAYRDAVRRSREARGGTGEGSHAWWSTHLHEAEAHALSGATGAARAICARAARDAGDRDNRIVAWRLRIEALVHAARGDEHEAVDCAERALEILGPDAPPFHRLKGMTLVQRIRPCRSRAIRIGELTRALSIGAARKAPGH